MADRRERVLIDIIVSGGGDAARAAGQVALLERSLKNLDGTTVKSGDTSRKVAKDVEQVGTSSRKTSSDINQLTGRLTLMAQIAATLGPGLVPIGAVAAPAIAGLSTGLAAAALGGASLVAALQGVGEATKAVDAYNLDPTVESYEAAREALEALSPAAQQFVSDFQEFQPVLTSLRDASAEGWMPGLSESLDNLTEMAPRARDLLRDVGKAGGEALADSTASLASDRWSDFYDLIDRQAPEAITTLTRVVGNLSHGLAEMMVSAEPGSNRFMGWVDDVADGFDRWASSDQGREDVQAFLDYAATNGPRVSAFFGSLVDTVAQVVQAAAPLGGPVLTTLTAVSDIIGKIADSDLGTPLLVAAAGMSAFSRAAALSNTLGNSAFITKRFPDGIRAAGAEARAGVPKFRDFGNALAFAAHSNDTLTKAQQSGSKVAAASATNALRAREAVVGWGKGAATAGVPVAALGLLATGTADSIGITNTAAGAMIGTLAGPWGTAVGAAGGAVLDLSSKLTGDLTSAIERANLAASGGSLPQMRAELKNLSAEFTDTGVGARIFDEVLSTATFGLAGGKIRKGAQEVLELTDAIKKAKEVSVRGVGTEGNGLNLLTSGLDLTAKQFDDARLAGSRFFDMLSAASGTLDRRGQWRAYQEAIDAASDALQANGRTLNNNTTAGRANNAALDQMASSALTFAENLKGANRVEFLKGARDGIAKAAVDFGRGAQSARKLANDLIGVGNIKVRPKVDVDTNPLTNKLGKGRKQLQAMDNSSANPFIDANDAPFQAGARRVRGGVKNLDGQRANPSANLVDGVSGPARSAQGAINAIQGKTVTITTILRTIGQRAVAGGASGGIGANGGIFGEGRGYGNLGLRQFADGGGFDSTGRFFDRVPQVVTGGRNILWAEPETGREAYISDKPGMRDRNLEILEQAASWFGAGIETYANGGTRRGKKGGGEGFERFSGSGRGRPAPTGQGISPEAQAAIDRVADILKPINTSFDRAINRAEREAKRDLKRADSPKERREALADLRKDRLGAWQERLKKSTDALKSETEARKGTIDAMRDYSSTVAGAYRRDPFGNGVAGLQLQLEADENDANDASRALAAAVANGFDGALLDAVRESGDVNTIRQIGQLDRAAIDQLEQQYARTYAATAAIGDQASRDRYGAQLAQQTAVVDRLGTQVDRLGERIDDMRVNIRQAAKEGTRQGTRQGTSEGNRSAAAAVTAGGRTTGRGGGRRRNGGGGRK